MKRKNPVKKASKLRSQMRKKADPEPTDYLWVPSGCILFNLACSDRFEGAYKTGTMINIVGDSSSGKSILALSGMAAVSNMKKFDDYRLIYDDAEFADSFDHEKLFGENLMDRIESPGKDEGDCSTTIEAFFDYVMDALEDGRPFIYILDSFDAIDADAEIKKELENREFRKKGTLSKIKGSFQATKQKKASQMFRQICGKLKKTKSLLIIISQTRDNITGKGSDKYRAGGRALKFYVSIETWLASRGAITKTVHGVSHKIGVKSLSKIEKNKFTGKYKEALFPIYYDYGIDDITACIEYLVSNEFWKLKKQTIQATDFKVQMTLPKLVTFIEDKKKIRELKLYKLCQKCWLGVEKSLKLNRRSKF